MTYNAQNYQEQGGERWVIGGDLMILPGGTVHLGAVDMTTQLSNALAGTAAPVSISRIPTTGHLLAIWNHNPGASSRNPLTAAISKDEAKTWEAFRNIEDAPGDAWAYPAVTWIDDQAYLTYFNYTGGLSLQLKLLPATWFYQ